ncbi:MAG TPA: hypothetical protein VM513_10830 [Kofleriaceae bacterium]|nr:hypothetical protein [Kofleriaceae bacterium]
MQFARWFGLVVVAWVVLAGVPRADACGVWRMTDVEKKLSVRWLINSGTVSSVARNKRLAALYLDEAKEGLRVVRDKKVVYDIKGDKLRKYGKAVATLRDDGTIAFGARSYTVTFADEKELHGMPAWTLTVRRGDAVILESEEASALCAAAAAIQAGTPLSATEQQAEIRRRVAFYLAWREVGL